MEILTINGTNVQRGDKNHTLISYERVDDYMVHLVFNDGVVAFVGGEVQINGQLKLNSDEIISSL